MRVALVVAALAACTRSAPPPTRDPPAHAIGESNVARADYVGPKLCGDCHADELARWSQSLHRVMNANADEPGAVIGDFAGATLAYAGGEARFTREGGTYVMTLARDGRRVRYRVTRTIGRRGLQEYVGIEDGRKDEVRLPFAWWPRRAGWYPQPYFDPWLGDETSFDAYAPVEEPWAERCPWCHSTYPFELRIARARSSQVGHGLELLVTNSVPEPGRERLAVDQQVTTGISCESCHLGGRAHAAGAPIHFMPSGAPQRAFAEERRDAAIVNGVCAQCHSGPSPRLPDGTAVRNSSEALDLAASPCTGIKCTDCHDPHRADARGDEARAIAACTGCHRALADRAAATAHAGAGHAATNCLDCHMPRVVMGIDRFVRTHRIASSPNACSRCHLDRSLGWMRDALREWNVRFAPDGDLEALVGELWLASATPAFRILAADAYAHSRLARFALPRLLDGLADPLAYVRTWTLFAVEDVIGRRLRGDEYDPRAPADVRTRQLAALRRRP